jgi:hypothetical protein
LKDIIVENSGNCISYLGVNLIMGRWQLMNNVDKRIKKNNSAAYKILFNSIDVTVTVRCK